MEEDANVHVTMVKRTRRQPQMRIGAIASTHE